MEAKARKFERIWDDHYKGIVERIRRKSMDKQTKFAYNITEKKIVEGFPGNISPGFDLVLQNLDFYRLGTKNFLLLGHHEL